MQLLLRPVFWRMKNNMADVRNVYAFSHSGWMMVKELLETDDKHAEFFSQLLATI
jgi:hypothetical protein